MRKEQLKFTSHKITCDAWLFYPTKKMDKYPVIVMAHGLGGTKDLLLENFAREFINIGLAAFVFDYRFWGESDGKPRNMTDHKKLIEDWHSAIKTVRNIDNLDNDAIILWGTSFAGGLVLTVAAQDQRIKATISQCPMLDGRASSIEYIKNAGILSSIASGANALLDISKSFISNDAHYVDIFGKPGTVAAMATNDAWQFKLLNDIELPLRTKKPFYNKITARSLLNIGNYRPIEDVKHVKCLALFIICEYDTVAPAEAPKNAAKKMERSIAISLPLGHFDIYRGDGFTKNIYAQIQFIKNIVFKK